MSHSVQFIKLEYIMSKACQIHAKVFEQAVCID